LPSNLPKRTGKTGGGSSGFLHDIAHLLKKKASKGSHAASVGNILGAEYVGFEKPAIGGGLSQGVSTLMNQTCKSFFDALVKITYDDEQYWTRNVRMTYTPEYKLRPQSRWASAEQKPVKKKRSEIYTCKRGSILKAILECPKQTECRFKDHISKLEVQEDSPQDEAGPQQASGSQQALKGLEEVLQEFFATSLKESRKRKRSRYAARVRHTLGAKWLENTSGRRLAERIAAAEQSFSNSSKKL